MPQNNSVKLLLVLISIAYYSFLPAQESVLKSRFSFKLGGTAVNSGKPPVYKPNPLLMAGVDYSINKFVDVGVYGGYASIMHSYELPYNSITGMYEWYSADSTSSMRSNSAGFYSASKAFYYGINSNIHILPLLFPGNMRIDLYATPKIGLVSEKYYEYNATQELVWSKPFVEYSVGLGLKYSFNRHWGIYGEYSLGRYYNDNKSRMLADIVIKL